MGDQNNTHTQLHLADDVLARLPVSTILEVQQSKVDATFVKSPAERCWQKLSLAP
jgi:hypothetical protein